MPAKRLRERCRDGFTRWGQSDNGTFVAIRVCFAADDTSQVLDILATMRIGSLSKEDMAESKAQEQDSDDPYAKVGKR